MKKFLKLFVAAALAQLMGCGAAADEDVGSTQEPVIVPWDVWDVAGHVRDQNLNPVPNVVVEVWGFGEWGPWKHYDSTTDSGGGFKVGGFIIKGGTYEVRVKNNTNNVGIGPYKYPAFTSWLWQTKDQQTGQDTPLGSLAYLNQIAGSGDCAGPDTTNVTKRCDFMYTTDANPSHVYPPPPQLLPVTCDKNDPAKPRVIIPWTVEPRAARGYFVRVDHQPDSWYPSICTGGSGSIGPDPYDRCVDGTTKTSLTVGPVQLGVPYRVWIHSGNVEGALSQTVSQLTFTCN